MDFGKRLSRSVATPSASPAPPRGSGVVARLLALPASHRYLAAVVLGVALLLLVTPVHFSTGNACHSVLKGLHNGAFSSAVQEFSLQGCQLTEVPSQLLNLRRLRSLDLSHNRLSSLPVGFGAAFPELQVLFLTSNSFSGPLEASSPLAAELRALTKLRMVAFRENQLTLVGANVFRPSVEWLILTSNAITSVAQVPPKVRKLMLSNNLLSALPGGLDESLTSLELLRLANNRIPAATLRALPHKIGSLKWFAAADNPPFDFWKAKNVKEFTLDDAETATLIRELKNGRRLGEGSAGVSYMTQYKGGAVIYKQFKSTLSSDGRIESEIALAVSLRAKGESNAALDGLLQEVVGITHTPLGVLYKYNQSHSGWKNVARPPSFESCTRDVYPAGYKLSLSAATRTLLDVAKAARELHRRLVCHGDLYGHNILHCPHSGAAMLIDLGAGWQFEQGDQGGVMVDLRAFQVLADELIEHLEGKKYVTDLKPFSSFDDAILQLESLQKKSVVTTAPGMTTKP